MRRLLTITLAALAAMFATGAQAAATDEALTYVNYATENALSSCMAAAGGGTANGTKIIQWTCNIHGDEQKWALDGYKQVVNKKSGKCLAIPNNSALAGVQLHLWTCDPRNPALKWNKVVIEGRSFALVNVYNGLSVAVAHAWQSDGVPIIQWYSNGGWEQQWYARTW